MSTETLLRRISALERRVAELEGMRLVPALNNNPITIVNKAKEFVAVTYRVSVADIESKSRPDPLVWARWVAIHLTRKFTSLSSDQIGRMFGNRDHGTIIHAVQQISNNCQAYPHRAKEVLEMEARFQQLIEPAQAVAA